LQATPDVGNDDGAARHSKFAESWIYRFPLPPHPIAAEQARRLTKLVLADWGILEILDEALIIAAELVTNAAKLGDVFHFSLSQRNGMALIEVSDSSEALPERQPSSLDRVDGRGLLLVTACSQDWGWRVEEKGGKTVWAIAGLPTRTEPGEEVTPRLRM
jgi:hypothetical protein